APTACVFYDLGVEQIPFSTLVAYLIRLLLSVTGNYARPGGNVFASAFSPAAKFLSEKEMFRAPVSGVEAIAALGGFGMMPPNILPEEVEGDHPERIRAVIVEGANPLLSYADTAAYRRAFAKLDLLVVIDPAMTETARAADYVLPAPVGYEKWEWSSFPNGYPEVFVQLRPPVVQGPEEALPEAEIYARLAEATGVVAKTPAVLKALGRTARAKIGGAAYQGAAAALAAIHGRGDKMGTMARFLVWNYRAVGPHLPGAAAASLWSLAHLVAMTRRGDVLRALGDEVGDLKGLALGEAIFQRILDHPEGVEVARVDPDRDYERNCGFEDGRMRLAPEPMVREMERALREPPVLPEGSFALYTGRRTHWNANTIHRDPKWRKGKGPHFFAGMHPDDAARIG
ncbi:MAG: molybdopterin-dependent oxidoreductase, partial [Myxococcales bacterium]|nr:molybdopterin-dependent oxidoreductase [Myxococcales bacterium]